MAELTEKDYEGIGRLTLAFNELEFVIEEYFAQILDAPEASVSKLLAEEDQFSRKVARFIAVLESISEEHADQEVKVGVDIVIGFLKEAKALATKRNEYVHAVVVDDFGASAPRLRIRRREDRVCDWGAIFALMGKLQNLTWDIDYHAYELALTLASRRQNRERSPGSSFA